MISLAACAGTSAPASAPVAFALHEEEEALGDGIAGVEFHGIRGIFIAFPAWRAMLVRIELDKRDLEVALARSVTAEKIATDHAEALSKAAAATEWRATWGPVLAFFGGAALAAASVIGFIYAGKALAPQQVVTNGR